MSESQIKTTNALALHINLKTHIDYNHVEKKLILEKIKFTAKSVTAILFQATDFPAKNS